MWTGLDFKSIWSKCNDLKSSPVRIGGFEITSHTNKLLLKVRWVNFDPVQGLMINFDPVLGLDQYTSPDIQYYYVSKPKQYGCGVNCNKMFSSYGWLMNY
jgi:hypothetical protein